MVEAKPSNAIMVPKDGGGNLIHNINFQIGITVSQMRIVVDRGGKFSLVLAIDDHVRGSSKHVTKLHGAEVAVVSPMIEDSDKERQEQRLENGSILTFWVAGLFQFSEVAHLPKGVAEDNPILPSSNSGI